MHTDIKLVWHISRKLNEINITNRNHSINKIKRRMAQRNLSQHAVAMEIYFTIVVNFHGHIETVNHEVLKDLRKVDQVSFHITSFIAHFQWHSDVIKWKYFPRYWPFVRGIHGWPVNSLHKGQWRGALMFSLIYAWIRGCVNNREAGDLRRHHALYDVTVMDVLAKRK